MWTIPATSKAHPLSSVPLQGGDRCVMGFAVNYSWPQIAPFVKSLRETAKYQGDIVLWVNDPDPIMQANLDRYGVVAMVFDPPLVVESTHIICRTRWAEYKNLLLHSLWDSILICDTRDIVFQSDPITQDYDRVVTASEDLLIYEEPCNRSWIITLYGIQGFKMVGDKVISCCGTVWGDRPSLWNYITKYYNQCEGLDTALWFEQGMHNWIIHNQLVPNVLLSNSDTVWTIGLNRDTDSYIDVRGHLLYTKDGRLPAVIHQYDRHPKLMEILNAYYQ